MPAKTQIPPALELSWTWFAASDPGLLRFRFAARATLSVALTVGVLYAIDRFAGIPIMAMALGFIVALFATVAVRDADPAGQIATTLLIPIPAAISFTVATALAPWPIVADLVFLAVIFAAVIGRGRGPRWTALGMIGYMAFFMGEFLHPPLAQVPDQLLGLAVGTGIAAATRFILLPDRPDDALPRVVRAIERQIALLLNRVGDGLEAGGWDRGARRRLSRGLASLNEAVLVAEDQMDELAHGTAGRDPDRLRLRLFAVERAAERLVSAATATPLPVDAALIGAVRRLEARLRSGEPRVATADSSRPAHWPDESGRSVLGKALSDLERALDAIPDEADRQPEPGTRAEADRHPEPAEGAGREAGPEDRPQPASRTPLGLDPTTIQAIQVTTACGIAIAVGHLVSSQRWFWAVITAFVMFIGANSRGDALYKGAQRVIGTLVGVVAGVLVATVLSGHSAVEMGLMLACIFLAFYSFQVSYAIMIVWFTIMIALLYGVMGYFTPSLLLVRLEETGIGAAAGIGVATLLLPMRTREAIRNAVRDFLEALGDLVDASVRKLTEAGPQEPPVDRLRALDRAFHAVRGAASSLTLGWGLQAPGLAGRDLAVLLACRYWAQELAAAVGSGRDPAPAEEILRRADLVRHEIDRLRDRLAGPEERPSPIRNEGDSRAGAGPPAGQPNRAVGPGLPDAAQALDKIDEALRFLAGRIAGRRKT